MTEQQESGVVITLPALDFYFLLANLLADVADHGEDCMCRRCSLAACVESQKPEPT